MPYNLSFFSYRDGLLRYKGKLFVGSTTSLRAKILQYMHSSGYGGHSGINATFQRVRGTFLWPGMRAEVQTMINACHQCQISKHETTRPAGLLQPLPVPTQAW